MGLMAKIISFPVETHQEWRCITQPDGKIWRGWATVADEPTEAEGALHYSFVQLKPRGIIDGSIMPPKPGSTGAWPRRGKAGT